MGEIESKKIVNVHDASSLKAVGVVGFNGQGVGDHTFGYLPRRLPSVVAGKHLPFFGAGCERTDDFVRKKSRGWARSIAPLVAMGLTSGRTEAQANNRRSWAKRDCAWGFGHHPQAPRDSARPKVKDHVLRGWRRSWAPSYRPMSVWKTWTCEKIRFVHSYPL